MGFRFRNGSLLLAASALFFAVVPFAAAQNGSAHFKGSMCILSSSDACGRLGYSDGDCVSARLSLPMSDADSHFRLSLFWPYKSKSFAGTGVAAGATDFKPVDVTTLDRHQWLDTAGLRVISQQPQTLDSATEQVTAVGDITGFEGSCFVRFRFSGQADLSTRESPPAIADEQSGDETLSNSGSSYLKTLE